MPEFYDKEYYENNREKYKKNWQKWYQKNKIKILEKAQEKRDKLPKKIKVINPEKETEFIDEIECYKNKFCSCGCGNKLPAKTKSGCFSKSLFIKGHDGICGLVSKEQKITFDGKTYYVNRYCSCGCGNRIQYYEIHKKSGIPEMLPAHNNRCKDIVEIDGIKYLKDKYCACGCGQLIPAIQDEDFHINKKKKYIEGHKKLETENRPASDYTKEELIEENGELCYKNIFCKCGCGKRLPFKKNRETDGVPREKYIWKHQANDLEYIRASIERGKANGKINYEKLVSKYGSEEEFKKEWSKQTTDFLKNTHGSYGQVGIFYSNKTGKDLRYDSSYELKALQMMENNSDILFFDRCHFSIPCKYNDSQHQYIPDFLVTYFSGEIKLIEVKPKKLLCSPETIGKFRAAINYCEEENFIYEIWTEIELDIKYKKKLKKNKKKKDF